MKEHYRVVFTDMTKTFVLSRFESDDFNCSSSLMEHSYIGNEFVSNVCARLLYKPNNIFWAGAYGEILCNGLNYHYHSSDVKKEKAIDNWREVLNENHIYVNHTKREWFNIEKQVRPLNEHVSVKIHPLPILTADGNAKDEYGYHGALMNLVGSWSGDLIELIHDEYKILEKGYKEIYPWFTEINNEQIDDYEQKFLTKTYKVKRCYTTYDVVDVVAIDEREALTLANRMCVDNSQVFQNTEHYSSKIIEN